MAALDSFLLVLASLRLSLSLDLSLFDSVLAPPLVPLFELLAIPITSRSVRPLSPPAGARICALRSNVRARTRAQNQAAE